MPDDETFEDALQSQCALLANEARRIMERGYALIVTGWNRDANDNSKLFNYISGGFEQFIKQWNETHKHNYIIVNIMRSSTNDPPGFVGMFRVSTIKRFAPLVVALDLVSTRVKFHNARDKDKTQTLTRLVMTDNIDYRCYDKASLQIALNILDMPQHRTLLTKRGRR